MRKIKIVFMCLVFFLLICKSVVASHAATGIRYFVSPSENTFVERFGYNVEIKSDIPGEHLLTIVFDRGLQSETTYVQKTSIQAFNKTFPFTLTGDMGDTTLTIIIGTDLYVDNTFVLHANDYIHVAAPLERDFVFIPMNSDSPVNPSKELSLIPDPASVAPIQPFAIQSSDTTSEGDPLTTSTYTPTDMIELDKSGDSSAIYWQAIFLVVASFVLIYRNLCKKGGRLL